MNIQGLMRLVTTPKWRQRLGDITTPEIVVNTLLSCLEDDPVALLNNGEIILDPCCGHATILVEIARRAKQTMDPMTIANQLWGYDIRHGNTARKLLANELGIDPKHVNIYQEDSLKAHMTIKNFRVVMNPPFNEEPGDQRDDAGNSNNSILYQEFVNKFAKEAKQVVSLNPAGWTIKKKDVEQYKDMGLKQVQFLPANHFPSVTIRSGLTVSDFVNGYNRDITITTEGGVTYTQGREHSIKNITKETSSIIKKLCKHKTLDKFILKGSVVMPKGSKSSIERACTIEPNKFKLTPDTLFSKKTVAYVNDGKNFGFLYTGEECNSHNNYKVVISGATSKHFLGNVVVFGPGVGICKNNFLLKFSNQRQADLYKYYLDSKLIRYVIKNVKFNDVVNTGTNSWGYIPHIDITQVESLSANKDFDFDKYLYKLFDLTPEEVELIEV